MEDAIYLTLDSVHDRVVPTKGFGTWEGQGPSHVTTPFVGSAWPGLAWSCRPDERICDMGGPGPLPCRKSFRRACYLMALTSIITTSWPLLAMR